ncbi:hypothetical protein [Streptomyces sp. NPDC096324]|uniref:hypothetical protein n=1 Tax=Streptomyces sp. NPDC096324 TaxID=3366085 RepID=UPI00380DBFF0
MSDYQPDEFGRREVPPTEYTDGAEYYGAAPRPGENYPSRDWQFNEYPPQHNDQRYVAMHSEAHDNSHLYAAGRDVNITQGTDFSVLEKYATKAAKWVGNFIFAASIGCVIYARFALGWEGSDFIDWIKGLNGAIARRFGK